MNRIRRAMRKGKTKLGGLTSIGPLKCGAELPCESIPRSALCRPVVATTGNTGMLIATWCGLALTIVPITAWLGICGGVFCVGSCKVWWIIGLQGGNAGCVEWLTGDDLAYWEMVYSPCRHCGWLIVLCPGAS